MVVLTPNSMLRYLSKVTVAQVTSTIRGIPADVFLDERDGMKGPCAVSYRAAKRVGTTGRTPRNSADEWGLCRAAVLPWVRL